MLKLRKEKSGDYGGTKHVNDMAFGQPAEGLLVEKLRMNGEFQSRLSIVAELNGKIVGHILFFPIKIKDAGKSHTSLALAPMSVLPEHQRKGIGGQLINAGLEEARQLGFRSVIVLGHPGYYPRFGFEPASKWHIKTTYDVPDEVFMAKELVSDGLSEVSGLVEYPVEFSEVE